MGTGSLGKWKGRLRKDKKRVSLGLKPLYPGLGKEWDYRPSSWVEHFNTTLFHELNQKYCPTERLWIREAGYFSYEYGGVCIDCKVLPFVKKQEFRDAYHKTLGNITLHVKTDRQVTAEELEKVIQLDGLKVDVQGNRIVIVDRVSKPKFSSEREVADDRINKLIKPLVDYLNNSK